MSEDVSIKEHFDKRFEHVEKLMREMEKRIDTELQLRDVAQRLYAENLESWKHHANEWREQLNEERANFLSKGMGVVIGALTVILLVINLIRLIKI